MTTYTAIANGDIDQDSPVTQPLMQLIRDNPIAIAEGSSGAPVLTSAWHPYNKLTMGDANTGKFYDFAVDGAVASIETPNFVDGYEYRIRLYGISGTGSGVSLTIELYKETSAAYDAATTIGAISTPANNVSGEIEVLRPRAGLIGVPVKYLIGRTETSLVIPATLGGYFSVQDPSEKRLKARLKWSTGNIDLGQAYLDKRSAII